MHAAMITILVCVLSSQISIQSVVNTKRIESRRSSSNNQTAVELIKDCLIMSSDSPFATQQLIQTGNHSFELLPVACSRDPSAKSSQAGSSGGDNSNSKDNEYNADDNQDDDQDDDKDDELDAANAGQSYKSLVMLLRHQYVVLGWLTLFVTLVGILGNMFAITVLMQPALRNPTNTFLLALSCSDLIGLCIIFFLIPLRYILVSHKVMAFYEVHTRLFPYLYPLATTFQFNSIFLMLAVCTCRTIIVYSTRPARPASATATAHDVVSVRGVRLFVAAVLAFSVLACLPFWAEYTTIELHDTANNLTRIYIDPTPVAQTPSYKFAVHLCLSTMFMHVLPLIGLSIMNYLLVVALVRTRRRKHELGVRENNELYITYMLIIVVLLFFVSQVPNLVLHVLHGTDLPVRRSTLFHYMHHWANFLLFFNSSANFAIYCCFGQQFRETARRIYCGGTVAASHTATVGLLSGSVSAPHQQNNQQTNQQLQQQQQQTQPYQQQVLHSRSSHQATTLKLQQTKQQQLAQTLPPQLQQQQQPDEQEMEQVGLMGMTGAAKKKNHAVVGAIKTSIEHRLENVFESIGQLENHGDKLKGKLNSYKSFD